MKLRSLAFLSLIALIAGCGGSSESRDEQKSTSHERIYAGDELDRVSNAQVVAIYFLMGNQQGLCSGTIIGANAVLTAAHCLAFEADQIVIDFAGKPMTVVGGAAHPGYTQDTAALYNDVGVLLTAEPFGVPAVPLLLSAPVVPGDALGIYGYGNDETNSSGVLRGGVIYPDQVTPSHIIDEVSSGQNTCQGDSGGPVIKAIGAADGSIQAWGVVGVTSSGYATTCTNQDLSFYTNLQTESVVSFISQLVPDLQVQ